MNVENSWTHTHDTNKHKQHSDTDCSAILNAEKGHQSKTQPVAKVKKKKKKRKKTRAVTRPVSPKLGRSKSVGAITTSNQVLLPVSPVRKVTKADINRLATRHRRKNPYAEQLEKELAYIFSLHLLKGKKSMCTVEDCST